MCIVPTQMLLRTDLFDLAGATLIQLEQHAIQAPLLTKNLTVYHFRVCVDLLTVLDRLHDDIE